MSRGKEIRPEFFQQYCKEKHSIYACIIFVIKIKEAVICVMKLVNGTISLDLTQLCLSLDLLMQFLFVKLRPFDFFITVGQKLKYILQLVFWRTTFSFAFQNYFRKKLMICHHHHQRSTFLEP